MHLCRSKGLRELAQTGSSSSDMRQWFSLVNAAPGQRKKAGARRRRSLIDTPQAMRHHRRGCLCVLERPGHRPGRRACLLRARTGLLPSRERRITSRDDLRRSGVRSDRRLLAGGRHARRLVRPVRAGAGERERPGARGRDRGGARRARGAGCRDRGVRGERRSGHGPDRGGRGAASSRSRGQAARPGER